MMGEVILPNVDASQAVLLMLTRVCAVFCSVNDCVLEMHE